MSQASKQQEKTFTGKVGFVLASVGAAIGLGAIWKFPYMAGAEGGAAFLLPYIIFSFTLAFGLLLTEITLGKAGKGGIVTAYRNLGGPFWSVLGYLGIIIGFVVLSFYSVVGGWCLLYFFEAIIGFPSADPETLGALFGSLSSSPWVAISAQVGFLALVGFVVAFGIRGGIELCSKILMPMLFIFMIILIITGLMQPGAMKGVEYLFLPDFSKFSWKTLLDSMGLLVLGRCRLHDYIRRLYRRQDRTCQLHFLDRCSFSPHLFDGRFNDSAGKLRVRYGSGRGPRPDIHYDAGDLCQAAFRVPVLYCLFLLSDHCCFNFSRIDARN